MEKFPWSNVGFEYKVSFTGRHFGLTHCRSSHSWQFVAWLIHLGETLPPVPAERAQDPQEGEGGHAPFHLDPEPHHGPRGRGASNARWQ